MTVDSLTKQESKTPEKIPISVQHELNKEVQKEATGTGAVSSQKQLMQLITVAQPQQSVQQTAQKQLQKGHVDIKI